MANHRRFGTLCLAVGFWIAASAARGATFAFNTGDPDGRMAMGGSNGTEPADDFVLDFQTAIDHATFVGLIGSSAQLTDITGVAVEIYRVFPNDSTDPPSGRVTTRVNSPSDVGLDSRDSSAATLTFTVSQLSATFAAGNSVVLGINPLPGSHTGGDGPVTGQEVLFDVTFTTPFSLAAGHYFFVPQVVVTGGFTWLSAPKPIVPPGTSFLPDLQTWIRNSDLQPDWLRVGTDIVGGTPAPTFNGAFSLSGAVTTPPPVPTLGGLGLVALALSIAAAAVFVLTRR